MIQLFRGEFSPKFLPFYLVTESFSSLSMATSDLKLSIFPPYSSSPSPAEEAMSAVSGETHEVAGVATEVEAARCACCGLTEDCTAAYIERVRGRHGGRWVCGLCAEAVKEEVRRRLVTPEEALGRHMAFCGSFRSSAEGADANDHLIAAMRQLLRRSLDSPRAVAGTPRGTMRDKVAPSSRSEDFFPAMAG